MDLSGRWPPFQNDLLRRASGKLLRMVITISIKDPGTVGGSSAAAHSVSRSEQDYKRRGALVGCPYAETLLKAFNVTGYYILEA